MSLYIALQHKCLTENNNMLFSFSGFPAAAYAAYAAGRGYSGYPSFGLPYPTGNLNLATLHHHYNNYQHLQNNHNHHNNHPVNHPLLPQCHQIINHPLDHLGVLTHLRHHTHHMHL